MESGNIEKTAEEKIAGFLKFGSRLGLGRMSVLMKKLGDPQNDFDVIHIAGTNGKGSCARYLYETLVEAGYRTGIYTSPYLEKFNERIELDREPISDRELDECTDTVLEKVREMVDEGCDSPTEFEVVTAVCFLYFSRKRCEIAVLEVGLGGRGDSTNIVRSPLVSVITSISYDHMDVLGDTIPEIAGEKAGIIKAGCPVVVSTEREDALKVFRDIAEEKKAPLYDARTLASVTVRDMTPDGSVFGFSVKSQDFFFDDIRISMGGRHQIMNAAEALTAVTVLRHRLDIPDAAVREGFRRAVQPGRFEVMYRPDGKGRPWVMIDGAHNSDGAEKLKEAVKEFFPGKRVLTVCGILADKDVESILDSFCSFTGDFIVTEPDNERKSSAYDLARAVHERGKLVYEIPSPDDAAALAMSIGRGYDLVLFAGSLYLIGHIRTLLREHYLRAGNICFDKADKEDSFSFGIAEEGDD